jgi:hypothetical protein
MNFTEFSGTTTLHLSLSWARSIQSIPPHPISQRSILIVSTHPHGDFLSGLYPSGFPTYSLYAILSLHSCYMSCLFHIPWLDHSNYTWRRVQVMQLLIMQFSPTLSTLCSQTSSVYFLTKCQKPSFTPIENHRQNYGFVYYNFQVFRHTRREKVLDWSVASVTQVQSPLNFLIKNNFYYS